MKKILYITTSYLLKNSSASIRNNSLVKGLIELGYNVEVYTVEWPRGFLSSYLQKENIGNIHCDKLPNIEMVNSVTSRIKHSNGFITAVKRILKQILFFPDECYQWVRLFDYNISTNYEYVITSSDLKSSHFVGMTIKRKFPNVKWIQVWGDPWSSDVNTITLMKYITSYYEKKILSLGDKIVYVSSVTKEEMAHRYCNLQSKMYYIPRGYYIEDNVKPQENKSDILHIAYTGLISSGRNIFHLLNVLEKKSLKSKIVLDLYGKLSENNSEQLRKYSCVNVYGSIDLGQLQDVYNSSSMMLYLSNRKGATQIPGKLYDYMGTTKPVLCLVEDENDAISVFLKKFDRCLVLKNDLVTIENSIDLILDFSKRRFPINKDFAPQSIARSFIDLF